MIVHNDPVLNQFDCTQRSVLNQFDCTQRSVLNQFDCTQRSALNQFDCTQHDGTVEISLNVHQRSSSQTVLLCANDPILKEFKDASTNVHTCLVGREHCSSVLPLHIKKISALRQFKTV